MLEIHGVMAVTIFEDLQDELGPDVRLLGEMDQIPRER